MSSEAKFWDRHAHKYAASKIKNMDAYAATLDRVRGHLSPELTVLEQGCGTGSTALLLAGSAGRYTGTDASPEMIEIAREKLAETPVSGLEFTVSRALETRFTAGAYDRVLNFNLLHLLEDLPDALARSHQLLKPGGLFITKTPCLGQMSRFIRPLIKVMQWVGKAPYVGVFKRAELEQSIRDAGFRIIDTHTFDGAPNSVFIVAEKSA